MRFQVILLLFLAVTACAYADVTATVDLQVKTVQRDTLGLGARSQVMTWYPLRTIGAGTESNQITLQWQDSRTLNPGASETIDLYGALVDAFGDPAQFLEIRLWGIENTSGSMTLTIGGSTTPWGSWSDISTAALYLPPGGVMCFSVASSGFSVSSSTGDLLRISNPGVSSTTYNIIFLGISE